MGQHGAGEDLVLPVDGKFAVGLDGGLEEVVEVPGIHLAGIARHRGGEVHRADDRDALVFHRFPGPGQLAVAAALGTKVDDHRAGFHPLHRGAIDQPRRRPARHGSRGDHEVGQRDAVVDHGLLLRPLLGRQLARIAADPIGGNAGIDELGTERFHLLPGGRTHIEGLDDGPKPPGGRDGLQAGNAGPHDECLRRPDRAGGRGQHRQELVERGRTEQHRLVAGDGSLGRQCVHRLGPGNPRHEFHRETGDLPLAEQPDQVLLPIGLQVADHDAAWAQGAGVCQGRRLDMQQHVGGRQHVGGLRQELDLPEIRVGEAGTVRRAGFHDQAGAGLAQLPCHFRHHGHAGFARHGFPDHANGHWHERHHSCRLGAADRQPG